jgi:hypothetical protein
MQRPPTATAVQRTGNETVRTAFQLSLPGAAGSAEMAARQTIA